MERQVQNHSESTNNGEREFVFLFARLLELADNPVVKRRVETNDITQIEVCSEVDHEETLLHVEHGGVCYKLVRTERPACRAATLSPREQEIVYLVSSGHANKTIARKLAISQHTVNTHVRRIFGKLGVNTRAEMVAYALQTGLVAHVTRYN